MPDTTPDPAVLRTAARAAIGVPGDAPVRWRYVTIEYGGAIAPVCAATSYTGISETHATHTLDDGSRDDTGIYDCCPYPHIEVWSDELAAYLVALLNADATRDAAVRAAAIREAADAVWENRAVSYALEIEGWEGAHALLCHLATNPTTTTTPEEH